MQGVPKMFTFLFVVHSDATKEVFAGIGEREGSMKRGNGEKSRNRRIQRGTVERQDVIRRLAELAFGKVNDCVRLVLEENPDLDMLDLSLLSEVKRSDKGSVEVRLIDRLRVLEQLTQMTGENQSDLEVFLQGLQSGEEK